MGQHPHRATDWATQPVNNILCDGHEPGRHEWVSTMCATREREGANKNGWNTQGGAGIHAGTFRRIHSPTRGAHCRPLDPRLASLRSGAAIILENPKIRALTQRRLWVSPFLFRDNYDGDIPVSW